GSAPAGPTAATSATRRSGGPTSTSSPRVSRAPSRSLSAAPPPRRRAEKRRPQMNADAPSRIDQICVHLRLLIMSHGRTRGPAPAAAPHDASRYVVALRNGRYHEKLTVDSANVMLVGQSRDSTVITFDAASDTPNPAGGTYGTRGSYTLRVIAPDFRAEHLTIENAFDEAANRAKPEAT